MKTIDQLLIELEACKKAKKWALGKTFIEVYTTCHRGDWLNWLFSKTNPEDIQLLMLVKGHQANTVRHLMKDDRSLKAVDTAIAFGEGRATKEELINAADAAWAARAAATAGYAACAADDDAAAVAAAAVAADDSAHTAAAADAAYDVAADAAGHAARAAADAADADDAAWAAAEAAWAAAWAACIADDAAAAVAWAAEAARARQSNRQLTAEIFRKYISIEKFKI